MKKRTINNAIDPTGNKGGAFLFWPLYLGGSWLVLCEGLNNEFLRIIGC